MSVPLFSILIPSRNRLSLLEYAVASILRQNFTDYEIIISDNASEEDYSQIFGGREDSNLRLIRTESPLSVTENWNRALEAARGEYVIRLGDDDALAPGLLERLASQIKNFHQPDLLYLMAYHYCYPDVMPNMPKGYLCSVKNSPLFDPVNGPYELETQEAIKLGSMAFQFMHYVSFNAQHFIWKRSFIENSLAKPFFQSPYPDYFACFVTFMTCPRIVICPKPDILIGISKRSFGYFYARNQQAAGFKEFYGDLIDGDMISGGDSAVKSALSMPGSQHLKNWFLAALFAKRILTNQSIVRVDVARYRRLQLLELVQSLLSSKDWREALALMSDTHLTIKERLTIAGLASKAILGEILDIKSFKHVLMKKQAETPIYYPAEIHFLEIENHSTIIDAFDYLQNRIV